MRLSSSTSKLITLAALISLTSPYTKANSSSWQEPDRAAAERLSKEAEQLTRQATAESQQKAIEKYEEALALWRKLGDREGEAKSLTNAGMLSHNLSRPRKAIEYYDQALAIWQSLSNKLWEGQLLSALGWAYQSMGDLQKALDYYNLALPIRQDIQDRPGVTQTLNTIGTVYGALGDQNLALEYYGKALPLSREIRDQSMVAYTLTNIAYAYEVLGDRDKALDYINQALPMWQAAGNRYGEAQALNTAAGIHVSLFNPQKALENYGDALFVWQATGFRLGEGQVLLDIGRVFHLWQDYETALDYYSQALKLFRLVGNRLEQATTLNNIGVILGKHEKSQKALEYLNEAAEINRSLKNRSGQRSDLNSLGVVYIALNEPRKALSYLGQAFELALEAGETDWQGFILTNIGQAHLMLGEHEKALEYLRRALTHHAATSARGAEAVTQAMIARVERDSGHILEARSRLESTLTIVEGLRALTGRSDLRTSLFASTTECYELYIDLLMRLDRDKQSEQHLAEALQTSERARVRGLLESLAEAAADIRQGADPLLAERERRLQQLLNGKADRLTRLLSGKHTDEQAREAQKEVDSALSESREVQARLRAQSPRYAALTQPQPLSLKDIQEQVLDKDTLMLEYALGEERSYLWAVTNHSIAGYELQGRESIEETARRLHDLLITGDKAETRVQTQLVAAELSKMVLGPAAGMLANKRLLIVADGALQYIPFGALPEPVVSNQGSAVSGEPSKEPARTARGGGQRPGNNNGSLTTEHRPLIVDHEIVSLPSASVLALLRRELAGRPQASKTVAILADPVVQADDPRINQAGVKSDKQGNLPTSIASRGLKDDLHRSARESGTMSFERLRFTRQEADAIAALVPESDRLKAVDFDASKATATSVALNQYRIVHFATHGIINSRHPELSGLVLSLVDDQGRPQDGFLRLHDVYNMKLSAELVVLSACQTALGKAVRGEGLLGLTRGFMYAGAPRVVASLWDVKDEATAELMKRFYEAMLRRGLQPAAALRAAQVSMWNEKRWEAPYHWAGFVLQGEWR